MLKRFRRYLKRKYDFPIQLEIHSRELIRINKIHQYNKISKTNRINIIKDFATFIPKIFKTAKAINICLNKADFPNVEDFSKLAWTRLITRYDSYLKRTVKDEGIIFSDEGNEKPLRLLLRKMRIYNPTPSFYTDKTYNAKVSRIIEDIVHRKSHISYFIQVSDVLAYLLFACEFPKGSLKKYNINVLFYNLQPIFLLAASRSDQYGIVRK